jgi:hypothetical protein
MDFVHCPDIWTTYKNDWNLDLPVFRWGEKTPVYQCLCLVPWKGLNRECLPPFPRTRKLLFLKCGFPLFIISDSGQYKELSDFEELLCFLFFYIVGVEPDPLLLQPFISLLYQPWMIDGDDCGAIGGMNGKRNWSTRRRHATMPLWPSQIPYELTWVRTQPRHSGKPATNHLSCSTT